MQTILLEIEMETKEKLETRRDLLIARTKRNAKAIECIELQLKNLKEKPWSPKGTGGYSLDGDGCLCTNSVIASYVKFGTQGTKEQMENLRNPMMHLASEHAWARELDGVQPYSPIQENFYVSYDHSNRKFCVRSTVRFESKTTIHMTRRDAEAYAGKMNKGLIAFPYEVE